MRTYRAFYLHLIIQTAFLRIFPSRIGNAPLHFHIDMGSFRSFVTEQRQNSTFSKYFKCNITFYWVLNSIITLFKSIVCSWRSKQNPLLRWNSKMLLPMDTRSKTTLEMHLGNNQTHTLFRCRLMDFICIGYLIHFVVFTICSGFCFDTFHFFLSLQYNNRREYFYSCDPIQTASI